MSSSTETTTARSDRPTDRSRPSLIPTAPNRGAVWLDRSTRHQDSLLSVWGSHPHGLAQASVHDATWDAIQTDPNLGLRALADLSAVITPGPVLHLDLSVVFLIPTLTAPWHALLAGTSRSAAGAWNWGARLTAHLGAAADTLLLPQPGLLRRRKPHWLVEPDGTGNVTYAGELASALHTAYEAVLAPEALRLLHPEQPAERPERPLTNFAAFLGRRQQQPAEAS
ncbi:hypothetical protein ABT095_14900 [Kitasatospora sp. NPDC002227]|uniref:hypothetical protein n=1 Tax=Kitasatospora sp. NPDC002227 TaxID=3154773 RepID=UPI00331E952E